MSTPRVFAIVLAGGSSSRFGSDKLAAMLDGRPLLHHALDAVAGVADHIIVVIGSDAEVPILSPSVIGKASIARDAAPFAGPLAGLAAGLQAIGTITGHDPRDVAIVVGGDMPTLVPVVLRRLVDGLEADPALVAITLAAPDPAPLPLAVRVAAGDVAEEILRTGHRRSLRAMIETLPSGQLPESAWRPLDPAGATLRDIDMPGDLHGA